MYSQDQEYVGDFDSDEENASDSSDDDMTGALSGSHKKQQRLQSKAKQERKRADADSEDEFEKEMQMELSATFRALAKQQAKGQVKCGNADSSSQPAEAEAAFYDQDYFDSDSDEEGTSKEKKEKQHPVLSNDDLLYDPQADEDDQKWVDRQRRRCQPKGAATNGATGKRRAAPSSDAVLDCPACMTTLCMDCQRHDTYQNQYRAMFVSHCKVDTNEVLRFPKDQKKGKNKKKRARFENSPQDVTSSEEAAGGTSAQGMDSGDKYHPVHCEICNTEVGVYDSDEVYHFFNVLASYS